MAKKLFAVVTIDLWRGKLYLNNLTAFTILKNEGASGKTFDTVSHIISNKQDWLNQKSVQWDGSRAELQYPEGCDQHNVLLESVTGIPQGLRLGPGLFNIFINDSDDWAEYKHHQFVDVPKHSNSWRDQTVLCPGWLLLTEEIGQHGKGTWKVLYLKKNNLVIGWGPHSWNSSLQRRTWASCWASWIEQAGKESWWHSGLY